MDQNYTVEEVRQLFAIMEAEEIEELKKLALVMKVEEIPPSDYDIWERKMQRRNVANSPKPSNKPRMRRAIKTAGRSMFFR